MTLSLRLLAPAFLASAFALAACGGSGNAPTGTSSTGQGESAQVAAKGEHGPGHLPFLHAVLKLDDLSADQRAKVMAIADDYKAATAAKRQAFGELGELFAKSLDAGKLDDAAIDAKLVELDTLDASDKAALATALNAMHGVLTGPQRSTLVDSIAQHKGGGDWKEHKHDHGGGFGFGKGFGGPMRHMLKDLDLTDAQKDAFHAKMEAQPKPAWDHGAMVAKMTMIGDAFRTETFDAKQLDLSSFGPPSGMHARMKTFAQAAIDILDPSQRAQLAQKIRDFSDKMH
jgi:Spy/CpxP family protein refolding chaperone